MYEISLLWVIYLVIHLLFVVQQATYISPEMCLLFIKNLLKNTEALSNKQLIMFFKILFVLTLKMYTTLSIIDVWD